MKEGPSEKETVEQTSRGDDFLSSDAKASQWVPTNELISFITFSLFGLTLLSHILITSMTPDFMTLRLQLTAFPAVYVTFALCWFFLRKGDGVKATYILFGGMATEQLLLLFLVVGQAPFIILSLLNSVVLAGLILGERSVTYAGVYVCVSVFGFWLLKAIAPDLVPVITELGSESLLVANLSTLSFTICVMYISIHRFATLSFALGQKEIEEQHAVDALRKAEGENQRRALLGNVLREISEVATKTSTLDEIIDHIFIGTRGLLNESLFAFFQIKGDQWELVGCDGTHGKAFREKHTTGIKIDITEGYGTEEIRRDVASQAPDLTPYIVNDAQFEALSLDLFSPSKDTCFLYPLGEPQRPLGIILRITTPTPTQDLTTHRFCLTLRPILNVWLSRQEVMQGLIQTQKMETVGILSGQVAHDFNNLLSTVFGNSEMVLYQNQDNPILKERMTALQNAAQSAAGLTQKLLSFTRKSNWSPRTIDVNQSIREFIPLLLPAMPANIELLLALHDKPLFVTIDEGDFKTLLSNLILNAQEASDERGIIEVRTRTGSAPEGSQQHQVMITVQDKGCGMSEETLSKAFLPFFSTKKNRASSGLGLSTSYGIAQRSGGTLALESRLGKGTLVTMSLPRDRTPSNRQLKSSQAQQLEGETRSILTVNADQDVQGVLRGTLEDAGYQWIGAQEVEDIGNTLDRGIGIGCIIIDGEQTSSHWLNEMEAQWPDIPIIILGNGPSSNRYQGHFYIRKPIVMDRLLQMVELALLSGTDAVRGNDPNKTLRVPKASKRPDNER